MRLTGEGRSRVDAVDAGLHDAIGGLLLDLVAPFEDYFARLRVGDVGGGPAAHDALLEGLEEPLLQWLTDPDSGRRAAVLFQDDHVLGDVDKAPGEVAAIGGAEGGISQPLAGAVGGDEVLHHGEPFPEGGANGQVYDASGGVAHEASHACHLGYLTDVSFGAADRHEVDAAVLFQAILDQNLHLVCGVTPDGDRPAVPLLSSYEAEVVLVLDLCDGAVCG